MPSRLSALIERIAVATSRTHEETRRIADVQSAGAKFALFFVIFGTLAALYVPVFGDHFGSWLTFKPDVGLGADQWRVLYSSFPPCTNVTADDMNCPADPENPMLWESFFLRSDPKHFERVRARQLRDYWLGAVIDPDTLSRARTRNATQLLLGNIVSSYRIFIDGEFAFGSTRIRDTNPILIHLPLSKFTSGKPMYLAVQVIHDADVTLPDVLNSDAGGEGFVTNESANTYRNFMAFWEKVRPFSLLLAYAVIAGVFFFFWISSKVKQEYFYMSVFAIVGAFYQARKMDILLSSLSTDMNNFIEYVLRFYVASFGMFLGLAFSRTRRVYFSYGVPACMIAPVLLYLSVPNMRFELYQALRFWITPAFFFAGATVCFLQTLYLSINKQGGTRLPVRARRLGSFGIGLFALASFYFLQARDWLPFGVPMFWDGSEHFIFMIFMGLIALGEYKQQEFLVSKAPVSEYHRRPVLPERVSGAILVADLKDSEAFYRHRAIHSSADNPVTDWRNHFYDVVYKNNGIVINKKGDELVAFFDNEKSAAPLLNALRATEEIAIISKALESEFRRKKLMPPGATGFFFRAALTIGDIRPVWENFGGNREAYWEEAGNTTPFVEASRLMDIERQVKTDTPLTQLIVRDEMAEGVISQDRRMTSKFEIRAQVFKDKHGNEHKVAVFRPLKSLASTGGTGKAAA